jgi:hypothetical protein
MLLVPLPGATMHRWLVVVTVCMAGALSVTTPAAAPDAEIDNLIAFARLYGVVRWFYPSDAAASLDWDRFAVIGASRARSAPDPRALAAALEALVRPLGPGIEIGSTLAPAPPVGPADATLVAWRYYGAAVNPADTKNAYAAGRTNRLPAPAAGDDRLTADWPAPQRAERIEIDLGRGVRARVPLALSDADARAGDPDAGRRLESGLAGALPAATVRDTSVADVVVAWNVYRHFYPYWRDLGADPAVDWDADLRRHLQAAAAATTAAQQREVLERLVAGVHDGHGNVIEQTRRGGLPVALRLIEDRLVVVGADVGDLRPGWTVTAVDGAPAAAWLKARVALRSGTSQWRTSRALSVDCEAGASVSLAIHDGLAARTVALPCGDRRPPTEQRPAPVAELTHGIWYVDLTRAKMEAITPHLAAIAGARGVVFDVRGYPTDAGFAILPHLIDAPEHDRWMHVERIVGPFKRVASESSIGWNLAPKAPHIAGTRVFLTDGRAISYAESVMGYVADRRLGAIVGGPTAGANGNVAAFTVPSGRRITFTGMRVTRHDGTSRFHMIGVLPTVPLAPTIAGVQGGRDELLERALALIDGRVLSGR